MRFTTASLAATLMALQPVAADFKIFSIVSNQAPDPSQSTTALLFNNPPSCSDPAQGADAQFYNDASGGGFACDGCTLAKAIPDWDITRFEYNDNDGSDLAGPAEPYHFTIYQDTENKANYGMYDVDMNILGSCVRPADPQYYQCTEIFSVSSGYEIFQCTSEITIKDSN